MEDVAIIIGNGFDLDLGLPSRYSDFIESPEWEGLVKNVDGDLPNSLIAHLQKASKDSKWFDIEEEIHNFVASHSDNTNEVISEIKSEFNAVKDALVNYLKRVSETFKADERKLACQLIYQLVACKHNMVEIYFNYTNPRQFLKRKTFYDPGRCTFTYVHGNLRENNIVLGCDLHEGEKVNKQLSFMYKYNQLNRANHVARSLMDAKEIIFFGHSVNEMDFCYFREFFKAASASHTPVRHLTIITFDEESERNIKDNIRNQGISVTDLYNNLWTFSVIHTKKFYEGDLKEAERLHELLVRLTV